VMIHLLFEGWERFGVLESDPSPIFRDSYVQLRLTQDGGAVNTLVSIHLPAFALS
jgi:hypothetical protein